MSASLPSHLPAWEHVADHWRRVQERIAAAAARAGRDPAGITLVAVTKTFPPAAVLAAYAAGQRIFGENRPQEAAEKATDPALAALPDLSWHLVGHLQTNKVRLAVHHFALIHSLDSVHLAQALSRQAEGSGRVVPVLLEINIAGEASKGGFALEAGLAGRDQLWPSLETILALPGLCVTGLMCVPPIMPTAAEVRPYFRQLCLLRERLRRAYPAVQWHHLSMGMSDDFEIAIEEGATLVRLGRAIFGERRPPG